MRNFARNMESINRQLAVTVPSYDIERIAQACGITVEDVLDHLPVYISSYIAEELLYDLRTDGWSQAQFVSFIHDRKGKQTVH